jgi:hypothetical protein
LQAARQNGRRGSKLFGTTSPHDELTT